MAKTAAQIFSDMHTTIFGVHAEAITYKPFGSDDISTTAYVHDLGFIEQHTERGIIRKRTFRFDVLKSAVPTIEPTLDTIVHAGRTVVVIGVEHEESGKFVLKCELQADEELSNGGIRREDE